MRDSLSISVEEALRRLYGHRADWLLVEGNGGRWTLRKERLVAFMGMGLGEASIVDVLMERGCPAKDESLIGSPVLVLDGHGFRLIQMDEHVQVIEKGQNEELPDWWHVPLPLIAVFRNKITANRRMLQEFGALLIPSQDIRFLEVKGTLLLAHGERRLYLSRLEGHFYLVEDVRCDVSLAKDIGGWAAVGHTLWDRAERRGEVLVRLDRMADGKDEAEILPCRWENELLGYIEIDGPSRKDGPDEEDEA